MNKQTTTTVSTTITNHRYTNIVVVVNQKLKGNLCGEY